MTSHNITIYDISNIDGKVKDMKFVFCHHRCCERTKWWTFFQGKVAGWASSLIPLSQRTIGKHPTCTTWPGGIWCYGGDCLTDWVVGVVSWHFRGKFQVQRSAGFAQFSCFTHLPRFPRGVVSSNVTCSVLAFPATGRLFLPKVSFKCIAKRCRLLTFDSRSLHKAIEEGGLAEVPWMFFFDVFLCDRKRIKHLKTESWKLDSMTAWRHVYRCICV